MCSSSKITRASLCVKFIFYQRHLVLANHLCTLALIPWTAENSEADTRGLLNHWIISWVSLSYHFTSSGFTVKQCKLAILERETQFLSPWDKSIFELKAN